MAMREEEMKKQRANKLTPEQRETAIKNGLKLATVYMRIRQLGWPVEDAITRPRRWRLNVTKRIITDEQYKIAERNGIKKHIVYNRVSRGNWDIKDAITKMPNGQRPHLTTIQKLYHHGAEPKMANHNEIQLLKQDDTKFRRIDRSELRRQVRNMRLWEYFRWFVHQEKEGKVGKRTIVKYWTNVEHVRCLAPEMLVVDLENNRRNYQWLLDQFGKTHQRVTTQDFNHQVASSLMFALDEGYIQSFPHLKMEINSCEKNWSPAEKEKKKNKPFTFSHTGFTKFKAFVDFKLDEMLNEKPIYKVANGYTSQGGNFSEQGYFMTYAVGIHTGARFSEVIGFQYEDVSDKGISINKTWDYRDRDHLGYMPTKNDSSIRTSVIDTTLHQLIDRYHKWKQENGLQRDVEPLLVEKGFAPYNSVINDKLYKIEKRLKLPRISFHKLRHTYISVLIDSNISEAVIAKQVGHTDTNMIHKVYGHLLQERESREMQAIKGLMG